MKTFIAFLKKEWMECVRSGRLLFLLLLFTLFGIMNPAIAKLTPWMMETLSGSLEESGFVVTKIEVTALTSWTQYYKNEIIALLVLVIFCSSIFTVEYQKDTLITVITKGLARWKIVLAKSVILFLLWSLCYLLCMFITLGYTLYFWDNSIVNHLFLALFTYWEFGLFALSLVIFFSTIVKTNTNVLLGAGGILLLNYLLSLFPKTNRYLPLRLTDGLSLLNGNLKPADFYPSMLITFLLCVGCLIGAVTIFRNRKFC